MSYIIGGRIVTDGLVVYYDALNNKSYPGSGTSWLDLTPYNNTGSFVSSSNGFVALASLENYYQFPASAPGLIGNYGMGGLAEFDIFLRFHQTFKFVWSEVRKDFFRLNLSLGFS